jgi:hypothetical protein
MRSLFPQRKEESSQLGNGVLAPTVESFLAISLKQSTDGLPLTNGDPVGQKAQPSPQRSRSAKSPLFFPALKRRRDHALPRLRRYRPAMIQKRSL